LKLSGVLQTFAGNDEFHDERKMKTSTAQPEK
jgi:hypothetical protein